MTLTELLIGKAMKVVIEEHQIKKGTILVFAYWSDNQYIEVTGKTVEEALEKFTKKAIKKWGKKK